MRVCCCVNGPRPHVGMSTKFDPSKHPRNTDGRFSQKAYSEADDVEVFEETLSRRDLTEVDQRERAFAAQKYVPATSMGAIVDPRSTAGIGDYWDGAFYTSEYRPDLSDVGVIPNMPDDETPERTSGHALSGHRRTHRMRYSGGGVDLRMPSPTAMRRFADRSNSDTFNMPVVASTPHGTTTCWVRCTRHGDHDWSVEALGVKDPRVAATVSEAVESVACARRPTKALAEAGDLLQRRAQKAQHTELKPITTSSFIVGAGYRDADGKATIQIRAQRKDEKVPRYNTYMYDVPKASFDAFMSAESKGAAYNSLIKRPGGELNHSVELSTCKRCMEMYPALSAHKCRDKKVKHSSPRARATPQMRASQRVASRKGAGHRLKTLSRKMNEKMMELFG